MSIITQKRTWNGIPVRIETNNETGKVEVYGIKQGSFGLVDTLLVSSNGVGSDWTIPNLATLTNSFNNTNKKRSTQKEVERAFFLEGYKVFNNDRAAVLNNPENYDSFRDSVIRRQQFYDQGTPLVSNPNTGLNINDEGEPTTLANQPPPNTGQQTPPQSSQQGGGAPIGPKKDDTTVTESPDDQSGSKTLNPGLRNTVQPSYTVGNVGLLRYPLANLEAARDLGITYDYIKISIQDWESSIGEGGYQGGVTNQGGDNVRGGTSLRGVSRYTQKKAQYGSIILPMTNELSSTNGVSWGEQSANSIQMALASSVNSYLTKIGQKGFTFEGLKGLGSDLIDNAQGFLQQGLNNKSAVASLLAGYVVGNTSLATRASGIVINPNLELLFSGPKLRSFGFNFQFAPRFKEEAEMVRKIVRSLKMFSSPAIDQTGSLFLRSPKIFQLEYIYNGDGGDEANGELHPYLNKIKPCVLETVTVNYTPNGKYMTYADGGSMVQTTLQLQFKEVEPIYERDYVDDTHPTGY